MPLSIHPPSGAGHASPASSRGGPLLLAAVLFLVTLAVTFGAWNNARQAALSEFENNFNHRARDMAVVIVRRMAVYEQVLRGAQGFLRGSVEISRKDFADYFAVLKLDQHFPGIEALGIATIIPKEKLGAHVAAMRRQGFAGYEVHPGGERAIYTSITHIEPFQNRNLRAFGFDMFSEPVRQAAMIAARDTGKAAVTGKVTLVQEGGNNVQSGFLMYLPVFRAGLPVATVEQRRAAILGWVYAPFRMNDLMRGLGGEHAGDLEIGIHDGQRSAESELYRSGAPRTGRARPMFNTSEVINMSGRQWTLDIASAPSFEARLNTTRAWVIGLTGTGFGFLLSLIVWLLATERRRALELAEEMTLELRQSHDRIKAEQQRMKVILDNAYDGFIAIDAAGRITDWNAPAAGIFGWSEQEAVGKDICDLVVPEGQREQFRARVRRFAETGTGPLLAGPVELMALHHSGAQIPIELALTALATPSGFGATAFVRDIAPRKAAAARERQRQERLVEARAALQRSQKLEAVGKLTGGVAHDFNNILHIISANVQLILRAGTYNPKRLHSILEAVERGAKLSAQLLAFARRQPLHPGVVDLHQLIERMDSLLHRAAGEAVQIQATGSGDLWHALVDPNQLENVILNLVINARDAMEGKGSVTIQLENVTVDSEAAAPDPEIQPGQYVMLAVSDTGSGMPPEVMERAFEPFFTTKPEGKGTGLGLSMAHGFVKQSGGHIRLSSVAGQGTTVTIYLPRGMTGAPDTAASRTNAAAGD